MATTVTDFKRVLRYLTTDYVRWCQLSDDATREERSEALEDIRDGLAALRKQEAGPGRLEWREEQEALALIWSRIKDDGEWATKFADLEPEDEYTRRRRERRLLVGTSRGAGTAPPAGPGGFGGGPPVETVRAAALGAEQARSSGEATVPPVMGQVSSSVPATPSLKGKGKSRRPFVYVPRMSVGGGSRTTGGAEASRPTPRPRRERTTPVVNEPAEATTSGRKRKCDVADDGEGSVVEVLEEESGKGKRKRRAAGDKWLGHLEEFKRKCPEHVVRDVVCDRCVDSGVDCLQKPGVSPCALCKIHAKKCETTRDGVPIAVPRASGSRPRRRNISRSVVEDAEEKPDVTPAFPVRRSPQPFLADPQERERELAVTAHRLAMFQVAGSAGMGAGFLSQGALPQAEALLRNEDLDSLGYMASTAMIDSFGLADVDRALFSRNAFLRALVQEAQILQSQQEITRWSLRQVYLQVEGTVDALRRLRERRSELVEGMAGASGSSEGSAVSTDDEDAEGEGEGNEVEEGDDGVEEGDVVMG